MRWWARLSGAELRARLVQRGATRARAELLTRGREAEQHAVAIDKLLGPE